MAEQKVLRCDECADFTLAVERLQVTRTIGKRSRRTVDLCAGHLGDVPEFLLQKQNRQSKQGATATTPAPRKKAAASPRRDSLAGKKAKCEICGEVVKARGLGPHIYKMHGKGRRKKTARKKTIRKKTTARRKTARKKTLRVR